MEAFRYRALDAEGRTVSGVLEADTSRHARVQLRALGLLPSEVDQVHAHRRAQRAGARGISSSELSLVTRQLATLLESGLTMEQALSALAEEAATPAAREVLVGVKTELTTGSSLANALEVYASSFPEFYCALVRGGEAAGALATVLTHLAEYLDAREALRQKTTLALLYPVLVSVVAVLIVAGLLAFVVPQVVSVFQQSRQELPWLTRALISLSGFLQAGWPYLLAALAMAAWAVRAALRRPAMLRRWHVLQLELPWFGVLVRGVNASRFAGTLAILVGGGVPLIAALESAARVMTCVPMVEAAGGVVGRVREGASLARALGETRAFPALLVHLVASGEASGKLAQMLRRAAQLETRALERRLAVFLALLEPVMILVMGGVVLMIVLAILLPIMEINQLVH